MDNQARSLFPDLCIGQSMTLLSTYIRKTLDSNKLNYKVI